MILDWTDWTFWLITLAPVAFGFCLRDIYEQWYFRKVRKEVRDEVREVHDLTRRLEAATERLNKANADAGAARLRSSSPKVLAGAVSPGRPIEARQVAGTAAAEARPPAGCPASPQPRPSRARPSVPGFPLP